MAALDFPSNPNLNQTYTAPPGQVYKWDGAVWTLTSLLSGGPAGGDLIGTYPNPTVALNTITTAKLAPGAALAPSSVGLAQNLTMQDGTAEQVLVEITATIALNRPVIVLAWVSGYNGCGSTIPSASQNITFLLKSGGTGTSGTQKQSQRLLSTLRTAFESDSWMAVLCFPDVGAGAALRYALTGAATGPGATVSVLDARIMMMPFS